jgi:tRNA A37 threonylcarbamoyladenosine dehydratase
VERLHARKTTVIGVGAIGHQVALQLTVIGIRWLRIVDFDGGAG